jgi:hypothetical protein
MERLSLGKAAAKDRAAAARLATLDEELAGLKAQQRAITSRWQDEKQEMSRVQVRVRARV